MKYRVFCETEDKHIEIESLLLKEVCPNSTNHTITPGSLSITDSNYNPNVGKDYKHLRKELIQYVIENFSTLTTDELQQASAHFCVPKEVRDMFFSLEEQINFGKEFHERSSEARKNRWNNGLVTLYNYTSLADSFIIGQELELLAFRYLNYGIEGTPEGDAEGLFDYVLATSGTSFENTGLAKKELELVVSGITCSGLADKLISILRAESQDL